MQDFLNQEQKHERAELAALLQAQHHNSNMYEAYLSKVVAEYRDMVPEQTIRQMHADGGTAVVMSWGYHAARAINYHRSFYAFRFSVTGAIFRGWVLVTLNGADLYEVTLWNPQTKQLKGVARDVYCEDLTRTIDLMVENHGQY